MEKKIFGVFLCFTILASSLLNISAANTETPVFGKRMENGIGNVTIYIDNKESRKATYWQRLIKMQLIIGCILE